MESHGGDAQLQKAASAAAPQRSDISSDMDERE